MYLSLPTWRRRAEHKDPDDRYPSSWVSSTAAGVVEGGSREGSRAVVVVVVVGGRGYSC